MDKKAVLLSYEGTPFLWHQRLKGHGVDCLGLVLAWMREIGHVPPGFDFRDYGNNFTTVTNLLRQQTVIEEIPQAMDLAVVSVLIKGEDRHLGVIVDDQLIHAHNPRGVRIQPLVNFSLAAFFRLKVGQ